MQTLYSWFSNRVARQSYIVSLVGVSLFSLLTQTTNGAADLNRQASSASARQAMGGSLDQRWLQRAFSHIDESEYFIRWQANSGAYESPNRAHELRFTYFPDGFAAEPRSVKAGANPWRISLRLKAYGRGDRLQDFSNNRLETRNNRGIADSGPILIEYINDKRGMRQNFIVRKTPPGSGKLKIEIRASLNDLDMDVKEGRVAFERKEPEIVVMTYSDLKVWDAANRILPAQMERMGDDSFAIVVEDKDAKYPITIDPLSMSPNWATEGNQASASYGASVASAGDVDGDGDTEVIVGAPNYDDGQTDEGKVFVFLGSQSGLSATANWSAQADSAFVFFGHSVASAGDVNNDGYDDIIIGTPFYNGIDGGAFVWFGSNSGLGANGTPANADWKRESAFDGDEFEYGRSVAGAGDVNGDGYDDIIIGAPDGDGGQSNEGFVYVYYGSASGPASSLSWKAESNDANAFFGWSVSSAGDVNNDGYDDIIAGSPHYINHGAAFVWFGGASGLGSTGNPANADWTKIISGSEFGTAVAAAGDVNGDGYGDIVVGAPLHSNGQSAEGKVFVFHGSSSGPTTNANWTAESNQANARFGYSVASAGEVNRDSYADLIVGAYQYSNGQANEGAAFVWYGGASGLGSSGTPANAGWVIEGDQAGIQLGYSVASAGDVNEDGSSEVIIGANLYANGQTGEGGAFVFHGATPMANAIAHWRFDGDLVDSTGNGHDLTLTAGTSENDPFAKVVQALSLTHNLARFESDTHTDFAHYGNEAWTMVGWFKRNTSSQPGNVGLFQLRQPPVGEQKTLDWNASGYLQGIGRASNGGGVTVTINPFSFTTGTWYFIAFGYDGSRLFLEVNRANRVYSDYHDGHVNTAGHEAVFGDDSTFDLQASFDEVAYFRGLVPEADLDIIYNNGAGRGF